MSIPDDSLIKKFRDELKISYVNEIIEHTRFLKYFQDMYCKHAFDAMGDGFRRLYNTQVDTLKTLKLQYKEKYGA